nr:MAG TPA: hypothetical protein [Bacteriophage sp.]
MPHKSTSVLNYFVKFIKAEGVVPVRIRNVVPEIRVRKSRIRLVPQITAPPV